MLNSKPISKPEKSPMVTVSFMRLLGNLFKEDIKYALELIPTAIISLFFYGIILLIFIIIASILFK